MTLDCLDTEKPDSICVHCGVTFNPAEPIADKGCWHAVDEPWIRPSNPFKDTS